MSAGGAIERALADALEDDAVLAGQLNGVFVGRPVRATPPYAVIGETLTGDWSTKTERGREARIAVTLRDEGESPARLHALMAAAEGAIEAMPRELEGWRVASLAFLRSRVGRGSAGPWLGTIEYRLRVMED